MVSKYISFYRKGSSTYYIMFLPDAHFRHGFAGIRQDYESAGQIMGSQIASDDLEYPRETEVESGLLESWGFVWGMQLESHEVARYVAAFGHEWKFAHQVIKVTRSQFDGKQSELDQALAGDKQRELRDEKARLRKEKWGF